MYCRNCGEEVKEGQSYCMTCGTSTDENVSVGPQPRVENYQNQSVVWTVFARIGFGVGLGSLICFWIFYLAIFTAPVGLVFSILGKKSVNANKTAKAGIILSSIALGLSLLVFVVLIAELSQ